MQSYPKPSAIGGTLIRKVIAQCKKLETTLPLGEPVLIAVSGGVDSMVLAHLLARYGRRLIDPSQITLLHLDHGWRPESGKEEKNLVKNLAKELEVGFRSEKLDPPSKALMSKNWEEDARLKRTKVFDTLAGPKQKWKYVFTAHHQDDLAETLFFRFLRGEIFEQNKGILFNDPPVLRPFLQVSKEEIRAYAKAEKVPYLEDPTNLETDQFRGLYRARLMPHLIRHFPGLHKTLATYANRTSLNRESPLDNSLRVAIESAIGIPLNRAQRTALSSKVSQMKVGERLSLPEGLQLKRLKNGYFIETPEPGNSR